MKYALKMKFCLTVIQLNVIYLQDSPGEVIRHRDGSWTWFSIFGRKYRIKKKKKGGVRSNQIICQNCCFHILNISISCYNVNLYLFNTDPFWCMVELTWMIAKAVFYREITKSWKNIKMKYNPGYDKIVADMIWCFFIQKPLIDMISNIKYSSNKMLFRCNVFL